MAPAAATEEEKAKKAAEKARRKAEFEAKRAKEGNPPKKKQLSMVRTIEVGACWMPCGVRSRTTRLLPTPPRRAI